MVSARDLTDHFYQWELRGRGWYGTNQAVMLEPAFRRCFDRLPMRTPAPAGSYDDGRRPTLLSRLAARVTGGSATTTLPTVVEALSVDDEYPILDALVGGDLVSFRLTLPLDYAARKEVDARLLGMLSVCLAPIAWEWVGIDGSAFLQVTCREIDKAKVQGAFGGFVPEAVLEEGDALVNAGFPDFVADFGLADEFFLPLRTFPSFAPDPYIPLVAALGATKGGERLSVQVLFERVRNPWHSAILEAVAGPAGDGVFADAPTFLPLAREKVATSLYAVALRVAGWADRTTRARELASTLEAFCLQYAHPSGNRLLPLSNEGYAFAVQEEAFWSRESCRAGMLLSETELLGLMHLPDASLRDPAYARRIERTHAARDAVTDGWSLGENRHRGIVRPVCLTTQERLQHMHVIGASGTGKSTCLINGILQDIEAGHGVAVLDPHGDLVDEVAARLSEERRNDVILFDPADGGGVVPVNLLSAEGEWERQLLASDLVGIFERLSTSWGDTMGTVLGNAILALLESPEDCTLLDLRRFLTDTNERKRLLATVPDPEVRDFWEKAYPLIGSRSLGPILVRLDAFLRPKLIRRIVGERQRPLDFRAVMDGRHIFLGRLSQGLIGEENAALLGSLLVTKFHQLALGRQSLAKAGRHPFFLYADEAQHFVTPSMASLLTEGRKYGVGLILAHQNLRQIQGSPVEGALLGNAYTRVVFRVGEDDARKLAAGFSFFEAGDLQRLDVGKAVARVGNAANDWNVAIAPLVEVSADMTAERLVLIREASRRRFGVVAEDGPSLPDGDGGPESPPSAPKPERDPQPSSPSGLAAPLPDPMLAKRRTQEHRYLKQLVKRLGEERGFRAVLEEAVGDGRVDVALHRDTLSIAVEISVSTEVEHEVGNLRKCLAGGYTHVVALVPDARKCARLTERAATLGNEAIAVIGPDGLAAYLDQFGEAKPTEQMVRGYRVRVRRQIVSLPSAGLDLGKIFR